MKRCLIGTLMLALSLSCTKNQRAKQYGGTASLDLPKGEKLVIVTWKNDNLWYLTRSMNSTDTPSTYFFKEESSFGILEGSYIITETK